MERHIRLWAKRSPSRDGLCRRRDIHTNNIQFPDRRGIYEEDEPRIDGREFARTGDRNKYSVEYSATRRFRFTTNIPRRKSQTTISTHSFSLYPSSYGNGVLRLSHLSDCSESAVLVRLLKEERKEELSCFARELLRTDSLLINRLISFEGLKIHFYAAKAQNSVAKFVPSEKLERLAHLKTCAFARFEEFMRFNRDA